MSRLPPPPRGPHKGLQVPDSAEWPGVEKGPQSEGPTCSEAALPSSFLLLVFHIGTNCPWHRYPYFQKLNRRKDTFKILCSIPVFPGDARLTPTASVEDKGNVCFQRPLRRGRPTPTEEARRVLFS